MQSTAKPSVCSTNAFHYTSWNNLTAGATTHPEPCFPQQNPIPNLPLVFSVTPTTNLLRVKNTWLLTSLFLLGITGSLRARSTAELPHAQGQGWRPRTPGCYGAGTAERSNPTSEDGRLRGRRRARGATPRSRSEGAAVRRYPSSKVRSSGCTLL